MKFALGGYGTRGDVEPLAALGRELLRRGHDVCMAVPPNLVGLVESVGLAAIAYGPDTRRQWEDDLRSLQNPISGWLSSIPGGIVRDAHTATEWGAALASLAHGTDVLVVEGYPQGQGLAANVAEYHGIPLVTLHIIPMPVSSGTSSGSPSAGELMAKAAQDAQRRTLRLPEAGTAPRQALEIHAYEQFFFPALAAESSEQGGRRAFVGALTLELPTDADAAALSWIAEGTPPIYFGFGSMPVPAEMLTMISAACAQLGERALLCAGWSDYAHVIPDSDHVKIVGAVSYAAVFPACRAVVHHGGVGTTAAGLRAGVPTLVLSTWLADQTLWGIVVTHLEVGFGRPLYATTCESLVADLRSILTPHCAARAREVAAQMTTPAESVAAAADLLEKTARNPR